MLLLSHPEHRKGSARGLRTTSQFPLRCDPTAAYFPCKSTGFANSCTRAVCVTTVSRTAKVRLHQPKRPRRRWNVPGSGPQREARHQCCRGSRNPRSPRWKRCRSPLCHVCQVAPQQRRCDLHRIPLAGARAAITARVSHPQESRTSTADYSADPGRSSRHHRTRSIRRASTGLSSFLGRPWAPASGPVVRCDCPPGGMRVSQSGTTLPTGAKTP